jgi:hypothetical protein
MKNGGYMDFISSFLGISPGVQALIILGLFFLLLVVSWNRPMAINLVAFLRDFRNLVSGDPGNRRTLRKARSRSLKRSRLNSNPPELGGNQGAQAHEQQRNA